MPLHRESIASIPAEELRDRARSILKSREQAPSEGWKSPHFGDGGWHTTPGTNRYTTEWEPYGDHILLVLDSEPEADGIIAKPQTALNQERNYRIGTVLKVGPGKWKEWVTGKKEHVGVRIPMTLRAGDRVMIGPFSDWESWDSDWEGQGRNVVICQEADVRFVIE